MKKIVLYFVGGVLLVVGAIGIIVPVLPTTPFVIAAAACFACNETVYNKLLNGKIFGPYIKHYRYKTGVPLLTKVVSLTFLWGMLTISIILVDVLWVKILLGVVGLAVSLHIGMLKTRNAKSKAELGEKSDKCENESNETSSLQDEANKK